MEEKRPDKKSKDLFKNIGLFTIATFIPKSLVFLMLPLYTAYLTTADYGRADLVTSTYSLVAPFLMLQIQDAVLKYTLDKKESRKEVLSIGIHISTLGGIVLIGICVILHQVLRIEIGNYFFLFLILQYIVGSLNNIFAYFCRGIDKVKTIAVASMINCVITICCNLLFLTVFKMGLLGYLIANTTGQAIAIVYMFVSVKLYSYFGIRIQNRVLTRKMIAFSFPMVFSAVSWWVNNASDRYILTYFQGVSVVGIYSVASKIPSILSNLGEVLARAFSISAIKQFDPNDSDGFLGRSYSAICCFIVILSSALMICNLFVSTILFSNEFLKAWIYVPPLLIAAAFNQFSMACQNILMGSGNTQSIMKTAAIGALCNTILNFTLIPTFGAYGASIATAIGFMVMWILRYRAMIRVIQMKNCIKKEALSYILIILQMAFAFYGNRFLLLQLGVFCILIFLWRDVILSTLRGIMHYKKDARGY